MSDVAVETNLDANDYVLAEMMLRVLMGGDEPYAPAVHPAAKVLAEARGRWAVQDLPITRTEARALFEAFMEVMLNGKPYER